MARSQRTERVSDGRGNMSFGHGLRHRQCGRAEWNTRPIERAQPDSPCRRHGTTGSTRGYMGDPEPQPRFDRTRLLVSNRLDKCCTCVHYSGMQPPRDTIIDRAKLVQYLLGPRLTDDKSRYLASAGFTQSNPNQLEDAIRQLASIAETHEDGVNEYGIFWRTEGLLTGPVADLPVVLIWLEWFVDGSVHFVTLKPPRRR